MKRIELLSPAKNYDCAIAAINSGADAIYIGASDFGARINASNSLENIENIVKYAHKFYVKVHVTINTILNDTELNSAIELVKTLYNIGVDAIIVQDMGLVQAAIDEKIPPIQIHLSTQCDNRQLEKIKFFDNIGVSRVILARESSLEFIKSVCNNVNCEVETFIHGALCVSYSGQCYFSYVNGGRSANKGCCAQPCRKKYSLVDSNGRYIVNNKYLLSLKDLNLSKSIEKIINAGVKSFKIEGRLKDVNYVTNVTNFYNNLINKYAKRTSSGKVFTDFVPNLDKTFNRGYTDYFLHGRTKCFNFDSPKFVGEYLGKVSFVGRNYFKSDFRVNSQDGLCYFQDGEICGFLVNKVEDNKIFPNKSLKVKCGTKIYRNSDFEFESRLKTANFVRKISTVISINNGFVTVVDEDSNTISSPLPHGNPPKNIEKVIETYKKQLSKTGDSDFVVDNVTILSSNIPFLPVSVLNEFRRNLFEDLMAERLKNYKKLCQKPISYADFFQKEVDYRGNVFNFVSEKFYNCCNCKVKEHALESINPQNVPSGVEVMRTKHCLRYAMDMCLKDENNKQDLYLEDETGKKYPLKFDCKNCEMVILNP